MYREIYNCVFIYIYIYIYRERERDMDVLARGATRRARRRPSRSATSPHGGRRPDFAGLFIEPWGLKSRPRGPQGTYEHYSSSVGVLQVAGFLSTGILTTV